MLDKERFSNSRQPDVWCAARRAVCTEPRHVDPCTAAAARITLGSRLDHFAAKADLPPDQSKLHCIPESAMQSKVVLG